MQLATASPRTIKIKSIFITYGLQQVYNRESTSMTVLLL